MQIKFTVWGTPKGKGRPRFVPRTGHAYTPKDTVNYENEIHFEFIKQCGNVRFPDDSFLRLEIDAFYSVPKNDSKKKRAEKLDNIIRPAKKPDMDNVVKVVADALNDVAYHDDVQIVECIVKKYFDEEPRIEVTLEEITPLGD